MVWVADVKYGSKAQLMKRPSQSGSFTQFFNGDSWFIRRYIIFEDMSKKYTQLNTMQANIGLQIVYAGPKSLYFDLLDMELHFIKIVHKVFIYELIMKCG